MRERRGRPAGRSAWIYCPVCEKRLKADGDLVPVHAGAGVRSGPGRAEISPEELELVAGGRPERTRITAALDARGMDGPEVDEALGVANALDTVVDSWEAGSEVPSLEEVRRLAFLTGYSVSWFFGPPVPSLEGVFICRR